MMKRMYFPNRRAQRRVEAEVRQAEYDAMSTMHKVARCLVRRGNSKKELARIKAAA